MISELVWHHPVISYDFLASSKNSGRNIKTGEAELVRYPFDWMDMIKETLRSSVRKKRWKFCDGETSEHIQMTSAKNLKFRRPSAFVDTASPCHSAGSPHIYLMTIITDYRVEVVKNTPVRE